MTWSEAFRLLLFYAFLVWFWKTMPEADRRAHEFWRSLGRDYESRGWAGAVGRVALVVTGVVATVIAINAS